MKEQLKQWLLRAGIALQRVPPGLPTGHNLARDLRLVVGNRARPVCIDAGAHTGEFVDLLRRALVNPAVHAFEPAPGPLAQLRRRHGATPGVTIVGAGLAERDGELTLHLFDNPTLNSFLDLAPGADRTFGGARDAGTASAPLIRLDDYAARIGLLTIDLLKIDTQGYEMHVLRGAERLFSEQAVHAVLVELNFQSLYEGQVWAHEVIGHLHRQGLQLVEFYEKCRQGPFLGWCTALFARRGGHPPR